MNEKQNALHIRRMNTEVQTIRARFAELEQKQKQLEGMFDKLMEASTKLEAHVNTTLEEVKATVDTALVEQQNAHAAFEAHMTGIEPTPHTERVYDENAETTEISEADQEELDVMAAEHRIDELEEALPLTEEEPDGDESTG